jgi:hypothetical protein
MSQGHFTGLDSVNDDGFDSEHAPDSESFYDPEHPMFPRDNPDLDSPATDADNESDNIPNHSPDRPCKLHSRKRLHVSDSAEQPKCNKR